MKAFRIFKRSIRDAFKSVFRNFSLSMASILCATITLLVVGISAVVAVNINKITNQYENQLDIAVYIKKEATGEDIENLKKTIESNNKVSKITLISNDERMKEMGELDSIFATYEENPLLNVFKVTVKEVTDLGSVTEEISKLEFVDSANYGDEAVDTIVSVMDILKTGTVVIVLALILVTAFLISNTIKLAIYARREEIEIMRLVGSSNTAIKLPFVFEGFTIGLLGSIIPIILLVYGYIIGFDKLHGKFIINNIDLFQPLPFVLYLGLFIAALGAIIGMLGSLRSVRKYLKI